MENASKALIIAGAILIAILLITIGIILINSGRDIVGTGVTAMSSQAIQAYNSQFTPYEGRNKSYADVCKLIDTVIASNASNANQVIITNIDYSTKKFFYRDDNIDFFGVYNVISESEFKGKLNKNSRYKIELYYNNDNQLADHRYNNGLKQQVSGCIMLIYIGEEYVI